MPLVDLMDETFVVSEPVVLSARIHRTEQWQSWWPDLELSVFMDRGDKGLRWSVSGALVGSCEVWLEPFADGTILHYYLRADLPTPEPGLSRRRLDDRLSRHHARRWKRNVNALKDELEAGRAPGCPRLPTPG
jgi:hypothetical protein